MSTLLPPENPLQSFLSCVHFVYEDKHVTLLSLLKQTLIVFLYICIVTSGLLYMNQDIKVY